ncbi:hypothetical protein Tco_0832969 [Tanacetum coccineum]
MSQPANDEFSQHLSDDEESNHEDASDTSAAPKQQQQDVVVRKLVTTAEIQAVEKERKAKNILLMAIPKEHMRRFHGMDDAKESGIFRTKGLEKVNDRFQQCTFTVGSSCAEVSTEDANHKFADLAPSIEVLAGSADEVIYSPCKQSEDWDLLHEDLEQIDN